jgi:hypothetical protein
MPNADAPKACGDDESGQVISVVAVSKTTDHQQFSYLSRITVQ